MTSERARRLADGLLTVVLAGLAFLLGCQELFDADAWWHLRAGRWILEHRSIPRVDPFTFAAAGRPWIDLPWLFQVALTLAYAAGDVAGMIVLTAALAASAIVAGLACRDRDWPAWVVAAAWLPGLLLASSRFDPRPEVVTLLCLAAFVGILLRARRHPGRLWLLLPIQVLWVNAHGLFILGPWALGLFLVDRAVGVDDGGTPPWRRVVPPSLAVGAACLANPYGLRGVLFPLELFPKLTAGGGAYKSYIGEFMSPRTMVATYWLPWGHDLYLRLFVFLLVVLPLVVLVTSLWRAWTSARPEGRPARAGAWAGGMVVATGLALAVALGLPGRSTPASLVALGRSVPWLLAASGLATAVVLGGRSRRAAALAVAGAGAAAAWVAWLVPHLFGDAPSPGAGAVALGLGLGLGLPAALLALAAGSRPFGPLLAASFAYLGLLSVRNMSLFGLVSGAVLAAELGEWAAQLGQGRGHGHGHGRGASWAGIAARLAVLGVAGLLAVAVATGRFFAATEECYRFGLRERPFYFAHDACRFARGPGLPGRALAFSLNQADVYVFHNAPARQVFIDGRLEVASRSAFETYVQLDDWLRRGDPRWANVVRRLGDPLILIGHEEGVDAEATLLADPRWRCVYLDAVAGLFLPRERDGERERERAYPTVDFAARHFRPPPAPAPPASAPPGESYAEALALVRLGAALAHRPAPAWSLRIPVGLVGLDRAREAIAEAPGAAGPWTALGHAALVLAPGRDPASVGPAAPWDLALDLPWAQASAAYRTALREDPTYEPSRLALAASFALRGMDDARRALETREASTSASASASPSWPGDGRLAAALDDLLGQGRPAAAVALAAEARRRGRVLAWSSADRVACAWLHLGEPSQARRAWLEAAAPPAAALRTARVADADLAAWDFDAAAAGYRAALERDPDLADARVGLALIGLERGHAGAALEAARAALRLRTTTEEHRRSLLEGIVSLCATYAP